MVGQKNENCFWDSGLFLFHLILTNNICRKSQVYMSLFLEPFGQKHSGTFGVFKTKLSVPIWVQWVPCPCFSLFNHYYHKIDKYIKIWKFLGIKWKIRLDKQFQESMVFQEIMVFQETLDTKNIILRHTKKCSGSSTSSSYQSSTIAQYHGILNNKRWIPK